MRQSEAQVKRLASRGRGALTARGTRREPIPGGSVAASRPPHGPATGEDTAPGSWSAVFLKACCSTCGEQTRHLQVACWRPVCRSACARN
ncbi:hypothetical protein XarjCFBP7653_10660 [Xanthomonas arboricola]|nr:hypothetical protein XarjCFBP7653_10660 [Xanthomonas arboricola]